jgi:uncharacterized membrane protein YsdA (DUF1294 family)/cold shock CspA family protein
MRIEGKITTWKDEQGYGFITPDNGGPQVFVHIHAILDGKTRPIAGDQVCFELAADEQGRPQAKYVRRAGALFRLRSVKKADAAIYVCVALFLGALIVLALIDYLRDFVPALYVALGVVTFLAYWKDKRAAQAGRWRTQESILQALSLAGGWPGALVAQRVLRHKSRKVEFLMVYWLTVVANVGVLGWSLTPQGAQIIQDVLDELIQNF